MSSSAGPEAASASALETVLAQARSMTIAGPPAPAYEGQDVLDDELLWLNEEQMSQEELNEREHEAEERIRAQGAPLSNHWIAEYTGKASKFWSKFYVRNADRFYKDRHYLQAEFPELADEGSGEVRLLEVGCGVGNAVLPLLETNPRLSVVAIDFAASAINILSQSPLARPGGAEGGAAARLQCSVCDVVNDALPVHPGSMHLVLCMFVLSAIAPSRQAEAIAKLAQCLRPGGRLLFRDYGRHDEAQLRFKKNSRLGENFYVRQDGTCAYYFSLEEIVSVCEGAGLRAQPGRCKYVRRAMANRAQKRARHRVWIQAVFAKGEGPGEEGAVGEGGVGRVGQGLGEAVSLPPPPPAPAEAEGAGIA